MALTSRTNQIHRTQANPTETTEPAGAPKEAEATGATGATGLVGTIDDIGLRALRKGNDVWKKTPVSTVVNQTTNRPTAAATIIPTLQGPVIVLAL